ncbi:hypothetical protein CEXT_376341 [Caerostris extrusa]|uniref:Uncharacterized protein n=1 Tax=Caerostris extrusa TaxID=172846 RepID=A0AAV4NL68_CAEEX|nr:hypothetical protein CEXT_376341 [Caerostris extrusa]
MDTELPQQEEEEEKKDSFHSSLNPVIPFEKLHLSRQIPPQLQNTRLMFLKRVSTRAFLFIWFLPSTSATSENFHPLSLQYLSVQIKRHCLYPSCVLLSRIGFFFLRWHPFPKFPYQ